MNRCLATVLLLIASSASADFRFEPPAPSTRSFVILHERNYSSSSCRPSATVTRSGKTIDVAWRVTQMVCTADHAPWEDRVPLGVLDAGTYEVRLTMNGQPFEGGTATLVVADATPSLALYESPSIVATAGGTDVTLEPADPLKWTDFCEPVDSVTIGGVTATSRIVDCRLVVTTPALSAGAKDIVVRAGETTYATSALLWFADPSETPVPKYHERILIPVLYRGPGAYGSFWSTEAMMQNRSGRTLTWYHDVSQLHCDGPGCGPRVFAGDWFNVGGYGNRAKGHVLFVPRTQADRLAFSLTVQDESRTETAWGTEVRVVREKDARIDTMIINGVPFDPRYRLTLRLYALDGGPSSMQVRLAGNDLKQAAVDLEAACPAPPCNSSDPAYAAVDLRALFPEITTNQIRTLEITPASFTTRPHWAVLSITNNATQQVTMSTPQ